MDDMEKIGVFAAVIGFGWLLYTRYTNTPAGLAGVADTTATVPWYLNYNTLPPLAQMMTSTLAQGATSINNNAPCSTCAMFGTSYGSEY